VSAALDLMASAMKEDGLHSLSVRIDDNGIVTYSAQRTVTETMEGLV
jgi:hypothetical protein